MMVCYQNGYGQFPRERGSDGPTAAAVPLSSPVGATSSHCHPAALQPTHCPALQTRLPEPAAGPSTHRPSSPAGMLVTEQPAMRGVLPHDHNHNRNGLQKDSDDADLRVKRFLIPEHLKELSSYHTVDRKAVKHKELSLYHTVDRKAVKHKLSGSHTLDKSFPNGFPNFNNFRNNPQGFYDNICYDAGYASERSPEEDEGHDEEGEEEEEEGEIATIFNIETTSSSRGDTRTPESKDDPQNNEDCERGESQQSEILKLVREGVQLTTLIVMDVYPFINEGTIFDMTLEKNSRGLGLSLSGGSETKGPHAGLLRIKRLYPQMPAWLCGQLQQGDIVLQANHITLSGLSSHEALEVIRTTKTSGVHLLLCRPPVGVISDLSGSPEPTVTTGSTTGRDIVSTSMMGRIDPAPGLLAPSTGQSLCGEFEVVLTKVKGSLGFTLRKRDNSVLGHTIRTLVREPALSDGRIKAGDKILSVNATDLCGLSHEEAISFLRTTPETVTIKLYRDVTQTPVSPLSPSEHETVLKPKPLRQEARDMLSDLAFRKRSSPSMSPGLGGSHSASPGNPRRRRLQKAPTPEAGRAHKFESLVRNMEEETREKAVAEEQDAIGVHMRSRNDMSPLSNRGSYASLNSEESAVVSRNTSNASTDTNSLSECSEARRKRPNFLDLDNRQSCPRKTQFSPPHENIYSFPSPLTSSENQFLSIGSVDSAPPLGSTQSVSPSFAHVHPAYQSINYGNIQYENNNEHNRLTGTASDYTIGSYNMSDNKTPDQKSGLLKWKGTVLPPEEDNWRLQTSQTDAGEITNKADDSDYQTSHKLKEVTIKLHRGWNSRLGFSLQPEGAATKVVAIYAGCVAAKDGRLKIGDQIIKVNEEVVEAWDTEKVIDILRKTHGKIILTVLQQPF